MFIRKKVSNGKTYYSLVERVTREEKDFKKNSKWKHTIRTIESCGTTEPLVYEPYLLEGDCLNLLKMIPDESIDMVLTDPPYATKKRNLKGKFTNPDASFSQRFGKWDVFVEDEKGYFEWTFSWVDEVIRTMRPGAVFICFFPYRGLKSNGTKTYVKILVLGDALGMANIVQRLV